MSSSDSSENAESFADELPPPTSGIAGGKLRLPVTPAPQKNANQSQLASEIMYKKHQEALREQKLAIERLEQALLLQQQQHKKNIDEIKSKTNDVIGSLRNQISVLKKTSKTLMSEVATLKKGAARKEPPANSASIPTPTSSWGLSTFLGASSNNDDDVKKLVSKCTKQMQNFHTRLQKLTSRLRDLDERVCAIEKMQPEAADSGADSAAGTKTIAIDDITMELQALASDMGCEWTEHKSVTHTHMAVVVSLLGTLNARLGSDLQFGQAPDTNEKLTQSNNALQDDKNNGIEVTGNAKVLEEAFAQLDRYLVAEDTTLQALFLKFSPGEDSASIPRSNCAQLIADTLGTEHPATTLLLNHLADESGDIPVQNVQVELETARHKMAERHAKQSAGDTPVVPAAKTEQQEMRAMLFRLQVQVRQQARQQRRQHQECQRGLTQVGDKLEDYVRIQERSQQQQQQRQEQQQQQYEQHGRRLDDHDKVITRQQQEWERKYEQVEGFRHKQSVSTARDIHSLREVTEAAQHAAKEARDVATQSRSTCKSACEAVAADLKRVAQEQSDRLKQSQQGAAMQIAEEVQRLEKLVAKQQSELTTTHADETQKLRATLSTLNQRWQQCSAACETNKQAIEGVKEDAETKAQTNASKRDLLRTFVQEQVCVVTELVNKLAETSHTALKTATSRLSTQCANTAAAMKRFECDAREVITKAAQRTQNIEDFKVAVKEQLSEHRARTDASLDSMRKRVEVANKIVQSFVQRILRLRERLEALNKSKEMLRQQSQKHVLLLRTSENNDAYFRTAFTKVLQRVAEAENRVDATSQRIVGLGDKKLTLLEARLKDIWLASSKSRSCMQEVVQQLEARFERVEGSIAAWTEDLGRVSCRISELRMELE